MKYLGIDWATTEHVLALLDDDGTILDVAKIDHSWDAVRSTIERLERRHGGDGVVVGIESGCAILSATLLAAGFTVHEVNPLAASRFRDRWGSSGAKDDRRDAIALADAVRTDGHRLPQAFVPPELLAALLLRCRDRQTHVDHRRRLLQQLRSTLAEFHPALLALDMPLGCGLVRDLFEAYSTPRQAARARRCRLARLIHENRVRKIDVEGLRELLRTEAFPVSPALQEAYVDRTRALFAQLATVDQVLREADARIAALFEQCEAQAVLGSVPGVGATLGPYLAAAIGCSFDATPSPTQLQTRAGTAPTTRRSGKQTRGSVRMRRGCHRGLQTALFAVARASLATCPWARAYVRDARSRGMSRNAALRSLSNKWAKIIAALLASETPYDEELHVARLRRAGVPWAPEAPSEAAA